MTIFDKANASVVVIRSNYPGLGRAEIWSGTAETKLRDGSSLKVSSGSLPDSNTVLNKLEELLKKRLTHNDEPVR